ncbi:MAG TPA: flagella basal body P-ring formation protein FlgA [Terriglobales bacterium]|jgi:hypothetical protein|nr:flagella basal body P-ring formation protein FlgA [Terriglobales bacterium]
MEFAIDNSWLKWTLLAVLAFSAEAGTGQTAVLLRAASVSRDTIRLSDLLPQDTPNQMRSAGEQIELGRTPQCHTVRVFERAEIEKVISSSPGLRGLMLSGPVSVQRTCFPIRREAVQRVVSEFVRQKTNDADLVNSPVVWPETIYALQENPALRVEQALPDPTRRVLQIRMRCVERAVCPSFWVAVPTRQQPHLLSTATPTVESTPSPVLVRIGQRVMLIFEDPPLRMQLLVTCLQSGSLGKQVRAMDPSTHRVFQAEVTGAGILRAHL